MKRILKDTVSDDRNLYACIGCINASRVGKDYKQTKGKEFDPYFKFRVMQIYCNIQKRMVKKNGKCKCYDIALPF